MRLSSLVRFALLSLALTLLTAGTAHAQVGRLTGIVTDAESGRPVENVQVLLQGTGFGAVTRANGRYFIINVPPGVYTVVARRLGYQEQRVENVSVLIDVVREVNFQLSSAAATLAAVRIEQSTTPLIQPGITGSSSAITAAELQSLPVSDIRSALSLQAGFLSVPENTDLISYADQRRGVDVVRIRGGRPSESLTMIDGIPVNNFLFGGSALDVTLDAVQQIDYIRGGFEPQYGNALSGIVNMAIREGTPELRGSLESSTSAFGGALGSTYDDLRNHRLVRGYVSGSVPATDDRLRYMIAGRQQSGAARVLEFDQDVYNPRADVRDPNNNFQSLFDLFPGHRAFGFNNQRDLTGKISFYFTPLIKLNVTAIDYSRALQPFDFDWQQTGFDAFAQCTNLYPDLRETCSDIFNNGREINSISDLQDAENENWYVRQASANQTRRLYAAQYNHTFGRAAVSASLGEFTQRRRTCTFASGVCQGTRLAYTYINGPFVYTGGRSRNEFVPLFGTEELYGKDDLRTRVMRADLNWQATDHHNLQGGIFHQRHEVSFEEWRDVGLNRTTLDPSTFAAEPWDAAIYLQDRIEYDFLTIKVGARFDYGKAPGRFFADPLDPTNGTTAQHVCENPTRFGLAADAFTFTQGDSVVTGLAACSTRVETLMEQAKAVALEDDFADAPTRSQFSPRIGVQFPLSERSSLFFNFGRFSQNPSMYDMYRGTGIGLDTEGTPEAVTIQAQSGTVPLLGNPHLQTEVATSYEIGYATEFLRDYAFTVTAFNKDQSGLSGFVFGGFRPNGDRVSDVGATYGGKQPNYNIIVNKDFQVVRGVETQIRRRVANYWGFELNYSYSRCVMSADPAEQEAQKQQEGDEPVTRIRCSIDQPHVFRGVMRYRAADRPPQIAYVGRFLRNTAATMTLTTESGFPYTPTNDITGSSRQERNSGTSPAVVRMNLYASKDWTLGNVRLGSFMQVNNLLDSKNCLQVYTSTGNCDSGGFTAGRLEKSRIGASIGAIGTYSQAFDRPDYLYPPRSISGGLRVSF